MPLAPSVKQSIMSSGDIRAEFLSYFRDRGHTLVAPSSAYPRHREGAYFTNAGKLCKYVRNVKFKIIQSRPALCNLTAQSILSIVH